MNRMGIHAKVVKPYQVSQFRAGIDVRVPKKPVGVGLKERVSSGQAFQTQIQSDSGQSASPAAFGKKNRAQTPVKGIITGQYGEAAEHYYKAKGEETFNRVSKHPITTVQAI